MGGSLNATFCNVLSLSDIYMYPRGVIEKREKTKYRLNLGLIKVTVCDRSTS